MATQPTILIDDGGVMNDNQLRGEQWPPLVGEFFVPRLGGTPAAWAEANRSVVAHIFDPQNWQARVQSTTDYPGFERAYWLDWLGGMCQFVNVACPSEDACLELARQAESYVIQHVRSAFPGVSETIRRLHAQEYTLHTASGEPSFHLQGYLEGMDVRDCFGRLYGPDLLNTLKVGPAYYERLFADANLAPADALVVDDSPRALAWARELGARTVLVGSARTAMDGMLCIGSLAELPDMLRIIG